MKTDKNSQAIREGTQSQIEHAFPDTNLSAAAPNSKLDYIRRCEYRQLTTEQLLQLLHEQAPQLWEMAQVVGKWVWVEFPQRPSRQITTALSQFGFNWNKTRQAWQHPCGDPCGKRAHYDPRNRYGSRPAAELQTTRGGQDND